MASRELLEQGAHNRAAVKALMETYPGITQREVAATLGISLMCANRHFNAVRDARRITFTQARARRQIGVGQP
jgi:hypothetical protein